MRTTEPGSPPCGQHVNVRGKRLWVHRSGAGGPAAVFLPGAGAMGLDYLLAHDRIAAFTTAVVYDRAGTGWSDDVPLPRSLEQVTDELCAVLAVVGVPPPYVLVGHSLGGAYAHRYAQRFADRIAGLVLLEPAHPDYDAYMPEHLKLAAASAPDLALPDASVDLVALARAQLESGLLDAFSDELRRVLIDKHTSRERLFTGAREGSNVPALFDELRAGGPLPDVPLIVLSGAAAGAELTMFQSAEDLRRRIAGSRRLFDAIAAATPHGEHRVLPDASHVSIPMKRPDAVADAVRDVLGRGGPTTTTQGRAR